MDEKQFEIITKKMDSLTKLLAFNIIKDKTVNEQVDILTKAGLKAPEIADVLGKTENQIYVTLNALRKKKKETSPSAFSNNQQLPVTEEAANV